MIRISLLTAASLIALSTFARAEDGLSNSNAQAAATTVATAAMTSTPSQTATTTGNTQTAFSAAINSIKGWFGADTPQAATPVAPTSTTTAMDDSIQVPPPPGVNMIEPASGASNDDNLQVPPPYYGPQSSETPRASAFDNASNNAFGASTNTVAANPAAVNAIAPAAGGEDVDMSKVDCDSVLKAASSAEEGEGPDIATVQACEVKKSQAAGAEPGQATPAAQPAQPGFEPASPVDQMTPAAPAVPLPQTQPAAGTPAPISAAPAAPAAKADAPATLMGDDTPKAK